MVSGCDKIPGNSPCRAENQEIGAALIQHLPESAEMQASGLIFCTGDNRFRFLLFLSENILFHDFKGIRDTDQPQCLASDRIVLSSPALQPVGQQTFDQFLLILQGRHHIKGADAISSGCSCNVMKIQIGDSRGNDLTVFVDDRIMNQCQIQSGFG